MATQRYISTSFWDDEWIRSLDPSEKFVYLYLMTNTLTNIAGVYKISIARICFDTGYNDDTIKKILKRFQDNKKAYLYNGYMILPTWPKHQKWRNRAKIKDGIISVLQDIPECVLEFLYSVGYLFDLSLVSETVISSKNRHQISGTTQRKVYEKYNKKCSVCGSVDNLDIHHVLPLKLGGDNSFENLQCVCRDCHIKIHSPDMLYENPVQSRYVQNYSDTDINTDIDLYSKPPADAEASIVPLEVTEKESALYLQIKTIFEQEQPKHRFTDYGKEGKAIKGLIKKCENYSPEDPDWIFAMIALFKDLRQSDNFYGKQPFTPSALNSSGIFDRVLNEARNRWESNQVSEGVIIF